ncbi:hypothetical protein ILUMI_09980 [Ignelater luminosus]|uniref:HTH psq-type domain-containing protein n=1 Tax=Ignelater luminosus TaxID=2038154 RepID=A0A8K0D1A8_IGNLU|nr:hypothetical protein ILUMI_09980 [Ignelater luminosus]
MPRKKPNDLWEKKMVTLKAAKTFNVPRRALRDLSKRNKTSSSDMSTKFGRKPLLEEQMEKELEAFLLQMLKTFYGFTSKDHRMAFQLASRNGIQHLFKQGEAGRA